MCLLGIIGICNLLIYLFVQARNRYREWLHARRLATRQAFIDEYQQLSPRQAIPVDDTREMRHFNDTLRYMGINQERVTGGTMRQTTYICDYCEKKVDNKPHINVKTLDIFVSSQTENRHWKTTRIKPKNKRTGTEYQFCDIGCLSDYLFQNYQDKLNDIKLGIEQLPEPESAGTPSDLAGLLGRSRGIGALQQQQQLGNLFTNPRRN